MGGVGIPVEGSTESSFIKSLRVPSDGLFRVPRLQNDRDDYPDTPIFGTSHHAALRISDHSISTGGAVMHRDHIGLEGSRRIGACTLTAQR